MRRSMALIIFSLLIAGVFAGCVTSTEETNEADEETVIEDSEPAYSDFDFSAYTTTMPSGENVFSEITYGSNVYGVRQINTPTHDLYADYAIEKMASYGLETEFQEFEGFGVQPNKNILGFKWGENRSDWIVFGAHYDTFATTQGSYDNMGGCAAVLEMARALSGYSFNKTLVFALWDCEEWGLYGSSHFVQTYKKEVKLCNFNYDCYGLNYPIKNPGIGDELKHTVGINGGNSSKTFNSALFHVADEIMKIPAELQDFHSPAANSDHASFGKAPIAYFYGDSASLELLCYPNVPLDTFATYVLAAGGPDEMKKGLEVPLVFSYYSAILYSECC